MSDTTNKSVIFEADGDTWELYQMNDQWMVRWNSGIHFERFPRSCYVRKNRYGHDYLQFSRRRLAGESRSKMLSVPADAVREWEAIYG